jgi:tryptophan synthase alpha chain
LSRIGEVFGRPGRTALMPYLTVGYPSLEATLAVVPLLEQWGCDIVELGIPFSDPLADGTTIQQASHDALHNGANPPRCLELVRELRSKTQLPLVFMTYFNPVLHYGLAEFCRDSQQAGVDGLIIPDLPPEEGSELEAISRRQGLDLIYLLAPTSTGARVRLVGSRSRGFIYLVSTTGVTGAREKLAGGLADFVARVRQVANQPLCVGFGISTPAQAGEVAQMADGVIVGSRIVQLMSEGSDFSSLGSFIRGLRQALDER